MTEAKQTRGRPRPQETIDRDEKVYQLLSKGPLSRTDIAEKLGITTQHAYMSLFRLKRDGYVERQSGGKEGADARSNVWAAVPTAG